MSKAGLMEIDLRDLKTQMKYLTEKIERLINENQDLKDRIEILEGKSDHLRFKIDDQNDKICGIDTAVDDIRYRSISSLEYTVDDLGDRVLDLQRNVSHNG